MVSALLVAMLQPPVSAEGQGRNSPELQRVHQARGGSTPSIRDKVLPDLEPGSVLRDFRVDLQVVVGTNGRALHTHISPAEPHLAFARLASEALEQWRFRPMRTSTGPVPSLVIVRFDVAAAGNDEPPVVTAELRPLPRQRAPVVIDQSTLPRTYDTDDTDTITPPTALRVVQAPYTPDAVRAKVQGIVTMSVVVMPDGTVGHAEVTESLHYQLDDEALVAVGYWLFGPARVDGTAVACRVTVEVEFRLH